MPIPATAQSVLDGTWKIDLSKVQMPKKPDVFLLQNGQYECKTCAPPIRVQADGQDHAVTGHPYFDTVAVEVIDDHTVQETDKKAGKVVATSKVMVAPDGKTATFEFTDSSNTNSDPVTGKGTATLLAKGPSGSHAISGSWHTSSFENMSDNGLLFTYKVDGENLTMTTPTGQNYTAKLDGTEAPYKGDPGTTSVSVTKRGDHSIEETDRRDGKVISVSLNTVQSDGNTMHITVQDKLHGTTVSFVAVKQ
uniref:Lipocalin-like domain-containing protein n=2 Tax=Paracidobacterium acidisoli TaxID=2303751 RepID=A0A372INL6_9BACT